MSTLLRVCHESAWLGGAIIWSGVSPCLLVDALHDDFIYLAIDRILLWSDKSLRLNNNA